MGFHESCGFGFRSEDVPGSTVAARDESLLKRRLELRNRNPVNDKNVKHETSKEK
jgi:hypothetical protein